MTFGGGNTCAENVKRFGLKQYNTQSLDLKDDSDKMEIKLKKYLTVQNRNKWLILGKKACIIKTLPVGIFRTGVLPVASGP